MLRSSVSPDINFVYVILVFVLVVIIMKIGKRRNKEMNVEEKVDNIPRQPQQQQQPVYEKKFLITVTDAESQQDLCVSAENIMIALMKFAVKYKNECDDWFGLSIVIEEVEYLE